MGIVPPNSVLHLGAFLTHLNIFRRVAYISRLFRPSAQPPQGELQTFGMRLFVNDVLSANDHVKDTSQCRLLDLMKHAISYAVFCLKKKTSYIRHSCIIS